MGLGLEILPQKPLPKEWQTFLCEKISTAGGIASLEKKGHDYYLLLWNGALAFHLWLSIKERDIFAEPDYIEAVKNPQRINTDKFLDNFKKTDYSIRLEYKGAGKDIGIALMVSAASILAEITEGIVLFHNEILDYKVDNIYLSGDLVRLK